MKIFKNGKIITMNNKEIVEAMVIEGDLVKDVGSSSYISKKYSSIAETEIDLNGKTVIPGFNDAHLHLFQYALSKRKVDLTKVKTLEEIKERINGHISKFNINKNDWIEGHGWNESYFQNKVTPSKDDLDIFSFKNPIILKRQCFHVAVCNSMALEIANINCNTPDPAGGKIGRYDDGKPNGLLYDAAITLAEKSIPEKNISQIKELYIDAFKDLSCAGITSVQCDDFFNIENPEHILTAFKELNNENRLPVRINLQMRLDNVAKIKEFSKKDLVTGKGDNFFSIGPVKFVTDGSFGAHTAALIEPYKDDITKKGSLLLEKEKLDELVLEAYKNNFQIAVHAIGDKALETTLKSFEKAINATKKNDMRPVVVHVQIGNKKLYQKMSKLNVIAMVQPVFVRSDWQITDERLGIERSKTSYAWKTLLDCGVKVAGSSDAPIEPFAPLLNIYTAVTRKDFDGMPENGWHPDEKLSVMDALKLFTKNAAYASFEEKVKGNLKPGKLADFVVLSKDICSIEADKIKEIEVLNTYVGGREVYKKSIA